MQERNMKLSLPEIPTYLTINKCTSNVTTNPSSINNQISTTFNSPIRSNSSNIQLNYNIYKPKRYLKKTSHLTNLVFTTLKRGNFNIQDISPHKSYETFKSDSNYEHKTQFIIKYSTNIEQFNKHKKNVDNITESKRHTFMELHSKLKKLLDIQNQLFFENTTAHDIHAQMSQLISLCYEYNTNINKYCEMIFTELQDEKTMNIKLRKRNFEVENMCQAKINELNDLNNYLNRYDVSTKIYMKKGKEETIENIRKSFVQKENAYLLKIYKLEDEIRDLTALLSKNKEYFDKFKESEKKVEEKRKQNEEMKFAFNKELHDKVIENAICQDKQYELNEHIKELNKEIEMLKEENEEQKRINIDVVTQNKKLITVINMRNENLAMLNEEMEMYMMMYDKEKGEHHNTNQALQALENRYYSELEEREEREKKEKEKKEKEEQNVNSNNYNNNNNNNNDVQVNKDEIEHKTDETTKNATIVVDTPQQQQQVKEEEQQQQQQQQPLLKLSEYSKL